MANSFESRATWKIWLGLEGLIEAFSTLSYGPHVGRYSQLPKNLENSQTAIKGGFSVWSASQRRHVESRYPNARAFFKFSYGGGWGNAPEDCEEPGRCPRHPSEHLC
jgi:hypothetical protein